MKKFVLQGVFVPYSVRVKDKDFFGLNVSEHHAWVEHVDLPEEFARHDICFYFLQILDINVYSSKLAKETSLMEDHLLSVWQ